MKKYSYPIFSRDEQAFEKPSSEPSWYNDFVKNLEGTSKQSNASLYDEINAILNNAKPKYSSVEEAVVDMQKRTGLIEYLNQKKAQVAYMEPEIFKTIPELKIFIDNFVKSRPGIAIEAVADAAIKINSIKEKLPNKNDVGDEVRQYINYKIMQDKELHPVNQDINLNLGKSDHLGDDKNLSDDPLSICEPATQN